MSEFEGVTGRGGTPAQEARRRLLSYEGWGIARLEDEVSRLKRSMAENRSLSVDGKLPGDKSLSTENSIVKTVITGLETKIGNLGIAEVSESFKTFMYLSSSDILKMNWSVLNDTHAKVITAREELRIYSEDKPIPIKKASSRLRRKLRVIEDGIVRVLSIKAERREVRELARRAQPITQGGRVIPDALTPPPALYAPLPEERLEAFVAAATEVLQTYRYVYGNHARECQCALCKLRRVVEE